MLDGKGTDVPPEIWDRVFNYCERIFRGNVHEHAITPKSYLHPLLFVSKDWHAIAERRVYSSVSLGYDRLVEDRNGQKKEIKGKDVARRFYDTVQSNPRLASLVHELHMVKIEESGIHYRLIGVCKNVEKIKMFGCITTHQVANDLKAALVKADLVSLDLYTHAMGEYGSHGGEQVFSKSEFIRLLPNWPRIENVSMQFSDEYESLGYTVKESESPSKDGACPALRSISVWKGTFAAAQLVELGRMAPNLESLTINVRIDCGEALQGCMQRWSSSLQHLCIFSSMGSKAPTGAGYPIIRTHMAELRELYLYGYHPLFTAEAIALAPKLEQLHFRGENRDGKELARRIEKGELPCLKTMDVRFWNPESENISFEEDEKISFELARELRGVCRKRKIYVRDLITEMEELDRHFYDPESAPEAPGNN